MIRWRSLNRRTLLGTAGTAGLSLGAGVLGSGVLEALAEAVAGDVNPLPGSGAALGERQPFSFEILKAWAKALAAAPWQKPEPADLAILEGIDYDSYQQIRFRPEASLRVERANRAPIQLFHQGRLFLEPVRIHLVEGEGAREVFYSPALFETPAGHPARALSGRTGFAGFRVMATDLKTDWLAFLGASYFRASGPFNQYGLSARGLAIGTGMPGPEEFPRFSAFWLNGGDAGKPPITIHALLDSPSVSGAYRFATERFTAELQQNSFVSRCCCQLMPLCLSSDFSSKVCGFLFDAFAQLVTSKTTDFDISTHFFSCFLQIVRNF